MQETKQCGEAPQRRNGVQLLESSSLTNIADSRGRLRAHFPIKGNVLSICPYTFIIYWKWNYFRKYIFFNVQNDLRIASIVIFKTPKNRDTFILCD